MLERNIREVWDFRLSTATPLIDRTSGKWVVKIFAKVNPDGTGEPLEEYDTGIDHVVGDAHDGEKLDVCYEWLRSVRDDYAHPDIDKLKPVVVKINAANAELAKLRAAGTGANTVGDAK